MFAALIILSSLLASSSAIINGTIPNRFQYPFAVSLQWDGKHKCGGALLDANTILTVAHCYSLVWVDPRQPHRVTALLGTINQHAEGKWPSRRVGIRRIIWPDSFRERYKSGEIMEAPVNEVLRDYLLLKTNQSIATTVSISYAPLGPDIPNIGDRCVAIGWGRYKFPDGNKIFENDFPKYLRQGLMQIVRGSTCWGTMKFDAAMMCAKQVIKDGVPEGIPCFGDSGSPFLCRNKNGRQYLAGLVKAGPLPCNLQTSPILFMRISNIRPWIKKHLSNVSR